ncbi:MAG: inner membrane protein [Frankiales bacterium]|nr:inner membrane protein [Frankiales bacterium]
MLKKATAASAPWCLVALIRWLDSADQEGMPLVEVGARDEPAHVATSLLVLLAALGPRRMARHRTAVATACASSVLIDVDHLPLYVDFPVNIRVDGGRPFTHSFSTAAALGLLAVGVRYRRRELAAASAGVLLHFVRDIATGPGLPLWWPWEQRGRRVPYAYYSRLLVVLAAIGSVRMHRWAGRHQAAGQATRSAKATTSST